jgi:hypothetical protein
MMRALALLLLWAGCCRPCDTSFYNFDEQTTPRSVLLGGFSYFEKSELGDTFVWCEGTRARLLVQASARHDRLLRFRGYPFRWPGAPQQKIKVALNGTPLGELVPPTDYAVSSIRLPKRAWKKGANELELQFAYAAPAKAADPANPDPRELAFAIDWLELTPIDPAAQLR